MLHNIQPRSELLQNVVFGLKKRSKAIKHRTLAFHCERVIEVSEDAEKERIELEARIGASFKSPTLRVHIWSDRWIWIDAREALKKGWKWEWSFSGRLTQDAEGIEFTKLVEHSISVLHRDADIIHQSLCEIWNDYVAQGPKAVE